MSLRLFSRIVLILVALLVFSLPTFAQDKEACETYDIVRIDTPQLAEAGIDLRDVRCTTIFVEAPDGTGDGGATIITHVFVIPESTVGAYLKGVDLQGQDLIGIDFSYANLTDANLTNIQAEGVMFIETNFTQADLTGAQAPFAYFNFAVFAEANAQSANLRAQN
jgi:uncharacterized protein YjbI with pentapeptide repeats